MVILSVVSFAFEVCIALKVHVVRDDDNLVFLLIQYYCTMVVLCIVALEVVVTSDIVRRLLRRTFTALDHLR